MRKITISSLIALITFTFILLGVSANTTDTPLMSFSNQDYTITENVSSTYITVTLEPALSITATVVYSTLDGTAISNLDYLGTTGTLTFTPGITLQTFILSVLDDSLPEIDETVFLSLTNPSTGTLGLYPTAVLTITDDGDP